MFTGIIEGTGTVEKITRNETNIDFFLSCPFAHELKVDQSLAHNGCCLTVVEILNDRYQVTAIHETLEKTNLGKWEVGTEVNLERCVKLDGRLDGHIVQGHVDTTGTISKIQNVEGSHLMTIQYDETDELVTVAQGSITVNGISLTVAESNSGSFKVAIIPYTWEFTNLKSVKAGDTVNLEFDIIGKYLTKLMKKNAAK